MATAQAAKTASLRICNNLLQRLSKAQHTVLCGRLSLFLARSVPLDDRSGLNIQAAVNLNNATAIEDPEQVLRFSSSRPNPEDQLALRSCPYQRYLGDHVSGLVAPSGASRAVMSPFLTIAAASDCIPSIFFT